MISVVINADTRKGYLHSARGEEWGNKSLHGVRSVDFLLEGVRQKMDFFRGYDTQCLLYVDQHEALSYGLIAEIDELIGSYGNNSKFILKQHDRTKPRWNDYLYLEALRLADGDYIAHFDQDCNAYRTDECDIIRRYLLWLNNQYKFICQPTDMTKEAHGMWWASTRFFICKKETLNFDEIESNLTTPVRGKHTPCFEHVISVLNDESVCYPPREDEQYCIFSWATYNSGTIKKLNEMSYADVKKYVLDEQGLFGPNDCVDKTKSND